MNKTLVSHRITCLTTNLIFLLAFARWDHKWINVHKYDFFKYLSLIRGLEQRRCLALRVPRPQVPRRVKFGDSGDPGARPVTDALQGVPESRGNHLGDVLQEVQYPTLRTNRVYQLGREKRCHSQEPHVVDTLCSDQQVNLLCYGFSNSPTLLNLLPSEVAEVLWC